MTETGSSSGSQWHYRFSVPEEFSGPEGEDIETREFSDDDAAEAYARELSKTRNVPVVIRRLHGEFDWRYITEADARP